MGKYSPVYAFIRMVHGETFSTAAIKSTNSSVPTRFVRLLLVISIVVTQNSRVAATHFMEEQQLREKDTSCSKRAAKSKMK